MDINFYWDFKNEKETFKQINILQMALVMACNNSGLMAKYYLEQAEQKLAELLKKGEK